MVLFVAAVRELQARLSAACMLVWAAQVEVAVCIGTKICSIPAWDGRHCWLPTNAALPSIIAPTDLVRER